MIFEYLNRFSEVIVIIGVVLAIFLCFRKGGILAIVSDIPNTAPKTSRELEKFRQQTRQFQKDMNALMSKPKKPSS